MKPNKDDKELAAYAKALGHPIRVQIMRQLERKGACQTGSLVDSLPVAQSTVSEHLRILREAGLVSGEIDGPRRCYCVNAEGLSKARRLFQDL
jgi:ArsR family transcriptional regulator